MTVPDDSAWMALACELARNCPVSDHAYSVGAVIVDKDGTRSLAAGRVKMIRMFTPKSRH